MPNPAIEDLSKEAVFLKKIKTGDLITWQCFYVANRDIYIRCFLWMGCTPITSYSMVQRFFVELLISEAYKTFSSTSYQLLKKEVYRELKKFSKKAAPPKRKRLFTLMGK